MGKSRNVTVTPLGLLPGVQCPEPLPHPHPPNASAPGGPSKVVALSLCTVAAQGQGKPVTDTVVPGQPLVLEPSVPSDAWGPIFENHSDRSTALR